MIEKRVAEQMAYASDHLRTEAKKKRDQRTSLRGTNLVDKGIVFFKRKKLLKESRVLDIYADQAEVRARDNFIAFRRFDEPQFQQLLGNAAATANVLGDRESSDFFRDLMFDTPEDRMDTFQSEDWSEAPITGRVVAEVLLAGAKVTETSLTLHLHEPQSNLEPQRLLHAEVGHDMDEPVGDPAPDITIPRKIFEVLGIGDQAELLPTEMPEHSDSRRRSEHIAAEIPNFGVELRFHYFGSHNEHEYTPAGINVEVFRTLPAYAA